jgi:hypothetical protein
MNPTITDTVFYRRALSEAEEVILNYVINHPKLTPYDIAEVFGQTQEVYGAIYHLTQNLYVEQDAVTSAIVPWGK